MADRTAIEWTDATWNPIRARSVATGKIGWHCEHISEGCRNCYAEALNQKRFGTRRPYTPDELNSGRAELYLDEKILAQPFHWRHPRKIFVGSMTDLFGRFVKDEWLDKIFSVMALCQQHTFQILTKRPQHMHHYIALMCNRDDAIARNASDISGGGYSDDLIRRVRCTLPNLWLGVSVEDQKTADERIPLLLQTPAAKRFISAEPLLGPIDMTGWGNAKALPAPTDAPREWSDFQWPDWIPERSRTSISDFWRVEWGRGAKAWMADNHQQGMPATGARMGAKLDRHGWACITSKDHPTAELQGRYIHYWNNVGAFLSEDGRLLFCSAGRGPFWLSRWLQDGAYRHILHWVIAGGESGPNARPMHPEWARSLRDQCAAAGVPFFFKQWGEWAPEPMDPGSFADHKARGVRDTFFFPLPDLQAMELVGKHRAGATLDGREHQEFPK